MIAPWGTMSQNEERATRIEGGTIVFLIVASDEKFEDPLWTHSSAKCICEAQDDGRA